MRERLQFLEMAVILGIVAILVTGFTPAWTNTGATTAYMNAMAMSADGRVILAISSAIDPLISTNYGNTWFTNTTSVGYVAAAMSADGSKMIATFGSNIYLSTNSGVGFFNSGLPSSPNWRCLASSADGTRLFAVQVPSSTPGMLVSVDSGATWTQRSVNSLSWSGVAVSADGNKILAVGNPVCISTNCGTNWTVTALNAVNGSPAMSADGNEMVVAGNQTYISTNLGGSWITNTLSAEQWNIQEVAMTADGGTLFMVGQNGLFYWSNDFGSSWMTNGLPIAQNQQQILFVRASADGGRLVCGGHGIWLSSFPLSPQLGVQPAGGSLNLSWTVPSTNLMLQQSRSISTPSWTMVTNLPVLNLTNLQEQVNLPCTNGGVFFRLGSQ